MSQSAKISGSTKTFAASKQQQSRGRVKFELPSKYEIIKHIASSQFSHVVSAKDPFKEGKFNVKKVFVQHLPKQEKNVFLVLV